jgi:hypothetical protein
MSNDYYNGGLVPAPVSPGSSAALRAEFSLITSAFDKLPALNVGAANQVVVVNSTGTGLETSVTFTGLTFNNPTIVGGTINGTAISTSSVAITGGTVNGTAIGGVTPAAGVFTSISTPSVAITGGTINGTAIGGVTPAAGSFTSLAASSATVGGANVVTVSASQTLTAKIINLANNTLVGTSAELAAAITDETGSGALVFATSPAFGGVPTAPTAATGTSTTQLATTAFVSAVSFNSALPGQTGNAGKFVSTDGTNAFWADGFTAANAYFFAGF